jgi:hypothetical protein
MVAVRLINQVEMALLLYMLSRRLAKLEFQLRALARLMEFSVQPELILVDNVIILLCLIVGQE